MRKAASHAAAFAFTSAFIASLGSVAEAQGAKCDVNNAYFYSLESRAPVQGKVEACGGGRVTDVTTGANAPRKGEVLVYDVPRFKIGISLVMRGMRNRPYVVRDDEPAAKIMLPFKPHTDLRWRDVTYTLPVVPRTIYSISSEYELYGFGDLQALIPNDANAYPLNASSIIVGVDGTLFISERSWLGMMSEYKSGQNPLYADVLYIQKNESPLVLRRAIIPYYRTSQIQSAWNSARSTNELLSDYSDAKRLASLVAVFWVANAVMKMYADSDLPEAFFQNCLGKPNMVQVGDSCILNPKIADAQQRRSQY